MTFTDVVNECYAGDKAARDLLFTYIFATARVIGACNLRGEDADDLAIEIAGELMEDIDEQLYDPEVASLMTWCWTNSYFTTVKHAAELYVQRKVGHIDLDPTLPAALGLDTSGALTSASPEQSVTYAEYVTYLIENIQRLPNQRWQEVLMLQYSEGLTQEEISAKLVAPLPTVKTWRRRALDELIKLIGREL